MSEQRPQQTTPTPPMTDLEFLRHVAACGLTLRADGTALRIAGPRSALTAALRTEIERRKEALCTLLNDGVVCAPTLLRPQPRDEQGEPLSFAQESLWLVDQLSGTEQPNYTIPLCYQLQGNLCRHALATALSQIVARHEILRTVYTVREQTPVQIVLPAAPVPIPCHDCDEANLEAAIAAQIAEPFDLTGGPILRADLFRLAPQDHVLLLRIHHIAFDAWSTNLLLGELHALYQDACASRPASLPALPIQYADYARWQRQMLTSERRDEQLAYWRTQLAGTPDLLALPTDYPRPLQQSYHGARAACELTSADYRTLRAYCASHGTTIFQTVLTVFQILLARYSGQTDILVGVPVAQRSRPELAPVLGYFLNMLPLRADFADDPTFAQALARLNRNLRHALAHQDLPFELLVHDLQPTRTLAHEPLIQVVFNHLVIEQATTTLGTVQLSQRDTRLDSTKFDLTLTATEHEDGLSLRLQYATDLFGAATMERFLSQLTTLLRAAITNEQHSITQLSYMPANEAAAELERSRGTTREYPAPQLIHALIAEQAARTPQATAIREQATTLTFDELEQRTNRLAHHLQALGVGPDVPVGLCFPHTPLLAIASIAVLKAGGTCLPLDPRHPTTRRVEMLRQAQASLVLTTTALRPSMPAADCLCLDTANPPWAQAATTAPQSTLTPNNLAYLLFTSGSTGTPKGAALTHLALTNHLRWNQRVLQLGPNDHTIQHTAIGFDAAAWELFSPLISGASAIYPGSADPEQPADLADLARRHAVTTIFFVPSLLALFVREPTLSACIQLRHLISGGEVLPPDTITALRERLPHATIHNVYGPTETTVWVATWPCRRANPHTQGTPLGFPVDNTQLYVLDPHLALVPQGLMGELYIGGLQLGRAYTSRPGLTAERFVPDPFSAAPGGRLYKTGDVVRRLPDGALEFLGRRDHQIKLRGQRIELPEIEQALRAQPGVSDAVVVTHTNTAGEPFLAAYLRTDQHIDPADLAGRLAGQLPAYMVPASFTALAQFPLLANGKLDRSALPVPNLLPSSQTDREPPATDQETRILTCWQRCLHRTDFGVTDNFFRLGGDSLTAIRLVAALQTAGITNRPTLRLLFQAPTVRLLAQQLGQANAEPDTLPLVPVPRQPGGEVLSFAQERLWMLDQIRAESGGAYNVPVLLRLNGALDIEALTRALSDLLERHEILRTTYHLHDGQPRQVVAPATAHQLGQTKLDHLSPEEALASTRRACADLTAAPFDLTKSPLLRTHLFTLGADDHVLYLSTHHITTDAWSIDILLRDLDTLYQDACAGRPASLPSLAIQYADYAHWQRETLTGQRRDEQLAYWRHQLAGAPDLLALPTDYARPPQQSFQGARVSCELSPAEYRALRSYCASRGATLYQTLLTTFQILLARYTGQADILVGTPLTQRSQAALEPLAGCFLNTLPLRDDFSANPSFAQALAQGAETMQAALAHQELPFEFLVHALQPGRSLAYEPLVQVAFNSMPAALQPPAIGPLTVTEIPANLDDTKLDLTLSTIERPGGLTLRLHYATDLFQAASMHRLLRHFRRLLRNAIAEDSRPVHTIPYLAAAEETAELRTHNATARAYPPPHFLHAVLSQQAARTPDAIAVIDEATSLSYRALDEASNRLAHHLQSLGVGPDLPVAVCLERSVNHALALFAILKAGGAYLPLDPSYPQGRITDMLAQAEAPIVLTTSDRAAQFSQVAILALDASNQPWNRKPAGPPASMLQPDNLAYMLFTSGSTGRPKACMISHRALFNQYCWLLSAIPLTANDRVLHRVPISFDAAIWEFILALPRGATLVCASDTTPTSLIRLINRHQVTFLFSVPSMLRTLLADPAIRSCTSIRHLSCGAEPLTPELVAAARQIFPECPIYNEYGPTEATIVTAATTIPPGTTPPHIPIGCAVDNTQLYVLDPYLQPQPLGLPGELYIGGLQVGRGYAARAALTAERFIPDPYSSTPGSRLYMSGDLVRRLPDGALEFLGRLDHQIKLHGQRIELGEIEAALRSVPGVRDALVTLHTDPAGSQHLAAYLVAEEPAPSAATLREHLRHRLPRYMLPASFTSLDAFPSLPNGKLDRKALPAPTYQPDQPQAEPPATPLEEQVLAAWQRILHRTDFGVTADFFSLGGDSLAAIRLASALQADHLADSGVLQHIFATPTVRDVAATLAQARPGEAPILPQPRNPAGDPLSFAQESLWLVDQLGGSQQSNYTVTMCYRVHHTLDTGALTTALQHIVQRHEILRTVYVLREHAPRQIVLPAAPLALTIHDCAEADLHQAIAARLAEPFDLARGPLLRPYLFRLATDQHILLICIHHIAFDAWSADIFLHELEILYQDACAGRQSSLPPLAIQYADYARCQREQLTPDRLEQLLTYWRAQLAGLPDLLPLPTDQPRPARQSYRGGVVSTTLPPADLQALRASSARQGATVFTTLLTAFQALLARYSNQTDILVGTPVANRTQPELTHLIGYFPNILPLRADLSTNPTFAQARAQLKQTVQQAIAHQDLPFELLVRALQPTRSLAYEPIVQIAFNHVPPAPPPTNPDPLIHAGVPLDYASAKYDLLLATAERPNGLFLLANYATDLFTTATMTRFLAHFTTLLRAALADDSRPVLTLPILSTQEEQQLQQPAATHASYRHRSARGPAHPH